MAIVFPPNLTPYTEGWRIQPFSKGGSPSIVGTKQIVPVPSGFWKAKGSFYLTSPQEILDARGFLASLDGQATPFLIGPYDYRGAPWNRSRLSGAIITPDLAAEAAAADPAFEVGADTTGSLAFSVAAAVAPNAITMTVQRDRGGRLARGQYFSVGQRMHIITNEPDDHGSERAPAGQIQIQFRPWSREAWAAGTPIEFARPQCLMRLPTDDVGLIELTTSPLSDLPLDLIEFF